MAVEEKRGCGYRKVGGLYLVSDGIGSSCHRLPINLHVCPTCSAGIKFSRGPQWINPFKLLGPCAMPMPSVCGHGDPKNACPCGLTCPVCYPPDSKQLMLWIGAGFYKTPKEFTMEAAKHGVSRRIAAIPRGFEIGKTWVYLAHMKAGSETMETSVQTSDGMGGWKPVMETKAVPGIFYAWRPTRIEKIITESMSKDTALMADLEKQGVTPVVVPDDDKDHKGSVHDKPEE